MPALLAVNDAPDVLGAYAVLLGKLALSNSASGILGAKFLYLRIRKFCMAVLFAIGVSAFLSHISQIVLRRTKKQMRRVAAFSIVAFMANKEIVRALTESQEPRSAMGAHVLAFLARFNGSVSLAVKAALPLPAVIGTALVYLFPKAFGKGTLGSGVVAGNEFSLKAGEFGNRNQLSTTAGTKFLSGFVRGMLGHVDSASNAVGHATGC